MSVAAVARCVCVRVNMCVFVCVWACVCGQERMRVHVRALQCVAVIYTFSITYFFKNTSKCSVVQCVVDSR